MERKNWGAPCGCLPVKMGKLGRRSRKKVRAGGSGERYLKRCKNSWCQLQLSAPYDVTLAGTPVHHMATPRLHVLIA